MNATWKCPHCGHENMVASNESTTRTHQAVYCDSEEGGCDTLVLAQPYYVTHCYVFTVKAVP